METQEHVYNSADAFREVVDELIQQTKNSQLHWHRVGGRRTEEHRSYVCLDHRGDIPILYAFSYIRNEFLPWEYLRVEGKQRLHLFRGRKEDSQTPDQNMELEEAILNSPNFKSPWETYTTSDSVEYYLQIRDDLRKRRRTMFRKLSTNFVVRPLKRR